jgi:hypothetical protein
MESQSRVRFVQRRGPHKTVRLTVPLRGSDELLTLECGHTQIRRRTAKNCKSARCTVCHELALAGRPEIPAFEFPEPEHTPEPVLELTLGNHIDNLLAQGLTEAGFQWGDSSVHYKITRPR